MKLKLKEDPKEWRKAVLLSMLGFSILSTTLRWRHVLSSAVWREVLVLLASVAVLALFKPCWFRVYYQFSSRLGFIVSQLMSYALLTVVFFLVITPLGLALRILGRNPLSLHHPRNKETYWTKPKEPSPLDSIF